MKLWILITYSGHDANSTVYTDRDSLVEDLGEDEFVLLAEDNPDTIVPSHDGAQTLQYIELAIRSITEPEASILRKALTEYMRRESWTKRLPRPEYDAGLGLLGRLSRQQTILI